MKQGAWEGFPLQIRAKRRYQQWGCGGGGVTERVRRVVVPMEAATEREGNKGACVPASPSIYC